MITADVAVIGGGPAGARTAERIASLGYDTLIIEKDAYAGETNVCGGSMDLAFAEGIDVPSEFTKVIDRWVYYFPFKVVEVRSRNLSFSRKNFDRYLADRAVRRGAHLLCRTLATQAQVSHDSVRISVLARESGESKVIESKVAVFADGPSTLAHKSFGIGFHGTPKNMAVGAIYEFEQDGGNDSYDLFFDPLISPWGYGWIFPKLDHLNVGVTCLVARSPTNLKACLDYLAFKHPVASKKLEGRRKLRFAAASIPLAPADRLSSTRVMTVGDAAGMVDAIWGGGIGWGLRASELVARVASEALEANKFDASFMARYDNLWKRTSDYLLLKNFERLTNITLPLQRLYANAYPRLVQFLVWNSERSKRRGQIPQPVH